MNFPDDGKNDEALARACFIPADSYCLVISRLLRVAGQLTAFSDT